MSAKWGVFGTLGVQGLALLASAVYAAMSGALLEVRFHDPGKVKPNEIIEVNISFGTTTKLTAFIVDDDAGTPVFRKSTLVLERYPDRQYPTARLIGWSEQKDFHTHQPYKFEISGFENTELKSLSWVYRQYLGSDVSHIHNVPMIGEVFYGDITAVSVTGSSETLVRCPIAIVSEEVADLHLSDDVTEAAKQLGLDKLQCKPVDARASVSG